MLDAGSIAFIDVTVAEMLGQADEALHGRAVELLLARDIGTVRHVLRRAGDDQQLETVYPSVQDAVDMARRELKLGGGDPSRRRAGARDRPRRSRPPRTGPDPR